MMPRVLLLEDDTALNETIAEYLEEKGYRVDTVFDGEEAAEKLYENRYDILLLDVGVPGKDGLRLLRESREEGMDTPAIYITSRDSLDDLEKGFASGADDYLRKPFALKELLIRIEALIKRSFDKHGETVVIDKEKKIRYAPLSGELFIGEETVPLGIKEGKLLKLFVRERGKVLSHETLYDHVWEYDETPSDAALRTYIKNLRKLLGKEKIVSLKKQGYKFVVAE